MPTIRCCQYEQQPTERKEIESRIEGYQQEYLFLACCAKCRHQALEIITIDKKNIYNRSRRRIKTQNIDLFFKNIKVIKDLPINPLGKIKGGITANSSSQYSNRISKSYK